MFSFNRKANSKQMWVSVFKSEMENGQEASVFISVAGTHQDGVFTLRNPEELQVCL